jgi:zinc transport system ATP-binding protein
MLKPPLALLSAESVSVGYDGQLAVENVDLTIDPGEIVSLIGPNGAGKTTLVRALLGLLPTSGGHITRRPGLKLGYVPQRLAIDPILPLSVRRFLALARPQPGQSLEGALAEVGVGDVVERHMRDLSGGELRRVFFARALLRAPELLVLDEPAQGVDVGGQVEIYGLISDIRRRRGAAALLVSHDLHLVMAATDRVVCLNRHVCCAGRPETVSRHPEYIALFGDKAAEALAVYTHRHDHRHDPHGLVQPLPPDAPPEGSPTGQKHRYG